MNGRNVTTFSYIVGSNIECKESLISSAIVYLYKLEIIEKLNSCTWLVESKLKKVQVDLPVPCAVLERGWYVGKSLF